MHIIFSIIVGNFFALLHDTKYMIFSRYVLSVYLLINLIGGYFYYVKNSDISNILYWISYLPGVLLIILFIKEKYFDKDN